MKICSNCGNKLADTDKKCNICKTNAKGAISIENENDKEKIDEIVASVRAKGNTQVKKKSKGCLPIIIGIVIIGAIIAALGGGDKDNSKKANAPGMQNQGKQEEKKEDSNRTITEIGQSIKTKNFIITLESVNVLKGTEYNKPADGKEFTELALIIENISDKDYSVSSLLMFDAYEDGFSINESISAQIASETKTMDGALAAGKKIKGKLAYEISTEWKELEIDINLTTLTFSTDGEVKILLKR